MWIAGVMQGLMWRAVNPDGTLVYTFVEGVKATYPFYVLRGRWLAVPRRHDPDAVEHRHDCYVWPCNHHRDPLPPSQLDKENNMADHNHKPAAIHERIETSNFLMIVLILIAVAFGGLWLKSFHFSSSTAPPSQWRA